MQTTSSNRELRIAMILAAGYGTRMGKLSQRLPKPLLPLNGLRIIEVILHQLARQGIERAVINLHHLAEKVEMALGDGRRYGLEIIYSEEKELLGSGGGIANAEAHFEGETILAVNADVLSTIDIAHLYQQHRRSEALATMNVLPSQNNRDYGLVLFDEQHRLRGFSLRGDALQREFQTGIFTGHQILTPRARTFLRVEKQSIITHLYLAGLKQNANIRVAPFTGRWIDVGTVKFYHRFVKQIRSGEVDLGEFM